jgi:hypothetical protein
MRDNVALARAADLEKCFWRLEDADQRSGLYALVLREALDFTFAHRYRGQVGAGVISYQSSS